MASNQFLALAIAAIVLPTIAMATEYVVEWKLNVNYTEWASDKVFHVGDTLVFHYQSPHNVHKVDMAGFKDCNTSGPPFLTSGNDTIKLAPAGKKWYICGYSDHCVRGQKLAINVESDGPAPAPASSDSYRSILSSWFQICTAAIFVLAMIAI